MSILIWFRNFFLHSYTSFTLPKLISENIYEKTSYNLETETQLLIPGLFQFINTPVHLLALDYYNRPKTNFNNRVALIKDLYKSTTLIRILRLTLSFGIGGVANSKLKSIFN